MKNNPAKPGKKDFHITVGVQPTNDLNLDKEIRMLKSAILYADKVKLYSPKVPSILAIARFENFSESLQLEFFEKILPYLSSKDKAQKLSLSLNQYREIVGKQKLDIHEIQLKNEFEKMLKQSWKDITNTTNKFVENSQMDQINSAIKAGILELHEFKSSDRDTAALNLMIEGAAAAMKTKGGAPNKEQDKSWISEFVEDLSESVSNDSTYPLLDDDTGKLIHPGVGNTSSIIRLDREKQTELASYLLEQLPLFDNASVSEILDIRKELDKPLTNFRSAVTKFSEEIKSAPWGDDFPTEAEKIYIKDVKPAMLEIEESVQSNKFLRTLVKKLMEKPIVLPASSAVSLAISQFSSLPKELATSLGVGIASASLIYEAYEEWAKKNKVTEQNQLYFYHSVGKRLKK
jgi:hypothetical protein